MDLLEGLIDLGDRKRKKRGGIDGRGDHHNDHDEHHDDDDHHDHYPDSHSQVYLSNPATPSTGLFCTRCSTHTLQGAKFCHGCGTAIEINLKCKNCGSKLPANASFCPQCGYGNG